MIVRMLADAIRASVGAPSSTRPAASTARCPNPATSRGVTNSAATVDNIRTPVAKPAPTPPAPAAAYCGTAATSR
jgi:hypothetical protein